MDTLKFHIGDIVYLQINPDRQGMVTGILFRPTWFVYYITFADGNERTHYEIELTTEKPFTEH